MSQALFNQTVVAAKDFADQLLKTGIDSNNYADDLSTSTALGKMLAASHFYKDCYQKLYESTRKPGTPLDKEEMPNKAKKLITDIIQSCRDNQIDLLRQSPIMRPPEVRFLLQDDVVRLLNLNISQNFKYTGKTLPVLYHPFVSSTLPTELSIKHISWIEEANSPIDLKAENYKKDHQNRMDALLQEGIVLGEAWIKAGFSPWRIRKWTEGKALIDLAKTELLRQSNFIELFSQLKRDLDPVDSLFPKRIEKAAIELIVKCCNQNSLKPEEIADRTFDQDLFINLLNEEFGGAKSRAKGLTFDKPLLKTVEIPQSAIEQPPAEVLPETIEESTPASEKEPLLPSPIQANPEAPKPIHTPLEFRLIAAAIAVLGLTAVALAFTVLNAATLGGAGIAVAAVGAVFALVGGVGLFVDIPIPTGDKAEVKVAPGQS